MKEEPTSKIIKISWIEGNAMQMNEGEFVSNDEIANQKEKQVVWIQVYFLLAK